MVRADGRVSVRVYGACLRVLPREFRAEAGKEMIEVFADGMRASVERGRLAGMKFFVRSMLDLLVTCWYEWRRSVPEGETLMSDAGEARSSVSRWGPDVRQAVRHLARHPLRALVGPLTVGIGIGATVLVIVLVNGIVLAPLPFGESDRLVRLMEFDEEGGRWWPSWANFVDWRENAAFMEGVGAVGVPSIEPIGLGAESVRASVGMVSRGFFQIIRAEPHVGRLFSESENVRGGEAVAVVSHSFWRSVLGGAPLDDAELTIGGERYAVTGVLRPSFRFLGEAGTWQDAAVWIPMERNPPAGQRTSHGYHVVARLADGVALSQARAQMNELAKRLAGAHGEPTHAATVGMTMLHEDVIAPVRRPLALLFGAALIVFVVAAFNLAATLLAEGLSRSRELSVRLALGATRRDLFRNLVVHAVILAIPGAVLGALFAWGGLLAVRAVGSGALPRLDEVTIDGILIVTAGSAAIVLALVAGVIPAFVLPAREVQPGLRSHRTVTASRGSRRLWAGFIAGQVALTVALAFACGLLARSFVAALGVDLGYSAEDVLAIDIALPESTHPEAAQRLAYWQMALDRLRAVPGVASVSLTSVLPHETTAFVSGTSRPGVPDNVVFGGLRLIERNYFEVLGIPVVTRGALDAWELAPGSVLIDQSLVDRLFRTGSPVGEVVVSSFLGEPRIVNGVVGTVMEWDRTDSPYGAVYLDYRAIPERARAMHVVVRTAVPVEALVGDVRDALADLDARVPATIAPFRNRVQAALDDRRLLLGITLSFAAIALLLAAIGVHAIVAFVVARSRKESGIRLVLGAPVAQVRRGALAQGLRPAVLGLLLGGTAAPIIGSLLEAQLFRVRPFDPLVLALTVLVLGSAATLGAWLPARRAARFEPRLVLRDD